MPRITIITSLYNSLQYLQGYFEAVSQISNQQEIEILLIHNAPNDDELSVINSYLPSMPFIRHIIVPREGLYATWNRGVKMAESPYLTIWNADDVRLPASLAKQADCLDAHPGAMLAYGDFVIVGKYGDRQGRSIIEPAFSREDKSFLADHHIGCFPMWRKGIHEKIGYFDEQLRLVADLDFQIRVAKDFNLVKCEEPLGYYLEGTPNNLSSNAKLQRMEQTAVHLRYGNFDRLFLTELIECLQKVKVFHYKWFGKYYRLKRWTNKEYFSYLFHFPLIGISVVNFPRHTARKYLRPYLDKRQQQRLPGNS